MRSDFSDLIQFTKEGIYCPKGDFWIDPQRRKNIAVITHAHSDHARPGHGEYVAHFDTISLIETLWSRQVNALPLDYGDSVTIGQVKVTLFPSGHILGASQVLIEEGGRRVIVAGDYKVASDGITPAFQPVSCDLFVTESTFAKPHYEWDEQKNVMEVISNWWQRNTRDGTTSVLLAYALGKSQRILANLDHSIGPIYVSEQVIKINEVYQKSGITLPQVKRLEDAKEADLAGTIVIAPSVRSFPVLQERKEKDIKRVSGWIVDSWLGMDGFALSDHADWNGLCTAVQDSHAKTVIVQHGFTRYFAKYLRSEGYDAYDIQDEINRSGEVGLF